jgi:hypothetical protein
MTQVESIQMNIHNSRLELNKARRVVCNNEIQKLHIQSTIDFYVNELKTLTFSLNCAIKQH